MTEDMEIESLLGLVQLDKVIARIKAASGDAEREAVLKEYGLDIVEYHRLLKDKERFSQKILHPHERQLL